MIARYQSITNKKITPERFARLTRRLPWPCLATAIMGQILDMTGHPFWGHILFYFAVLDGVAAVATYVVCRRLIEHGDAG